VLRGDGDDGPLDEQTIRARLEASWKDDGMNMADGRPQGPWQTALHHVS